MKDWIGEKGENNPKTMPKKRDKSKINSIRKERSKDPIKGETTPYLLLGPIYGVRHRVYLWGRGNRAM